MSAGGPARADGAGGATPPAPLTDSQWEAVRRVDQHLLVAAGAGTGKTTTVVRRILYWLGVPMRGQAAAEPLELRQIAAITFTNAAAADLKAKLRSELRRHGLRELAYEVDGARIGTIHGFCGDVLREFALRGGHAPGFRVLEEGEAAALVDEAVHEAMLHALETGAVERLEELFARYGLRDVEGWLSRLVGEIARLDRIAANRDAAGPLERTVLDLALRARVEVERRLREAGAVDFDRLVVWTRDLLRDRPAARHALQARLRGLVVDEFQDVDPVQKEIAWLLGEPESGRRDTPRLMLVGDPKQSIYRFRRADVTVWREVEAAFAERGLGAVVRLEENFRSLAPVLAFVDATAGRILGRAGPGGPRPFEVGYQPVRPTREPPPGAARPLVELIVLAGKCGAEAARLADAEAVARRAAELRDRGVPWRDMAALLSSWGALDIYQRALRQAGVPTYALRLEGFYDRREVVDLVLALETLRDPRDDRALLGFLRSPFVGVRDETLLAIALAARPPYWDRLDRIETREAELVRWGVALVREHAELRDRVPVHELLERLLDRSGYLAHLHALGEPQAVANVRKFLRIARQFREGGVGDFLQAVREIRAREGAGAGTGERVGDERLYGPGEDVVVISSIHSAKGLEWPVVFWCDLMRGPVTQRGSLLVGRDRIALRDPEAEKDDQPEPWRRLLAEEEAEEGAEDQRLWYVALTRARDRLILSGLRVGTGGKSAGAGDGRADAAILAALGAPSLSAGGPVRYRGHGGREYEAVVRIVPVDEGAATSGPATGIARPAGGTSGPAAAARPPGEPVASLQSLEAPPPPLAAPPGRARHSATELMVYARCARRHWFRYLAGLKEPPVERSGDDFLSAIARGQIVHDVLEHLEEEDEFDRLLEAAIGRWDPAAPPPDAEPGRRYRERLAREIETVRSHPDYRALAARPGARRELRFVHLLGPDAFVEGKVDLAAPDGDGIAALDVKTGDADAAAARRKAEAYALQRSVYLAALEALSGRPVTRFAFHFSMARTQVGGPLSAEERAAAGPAVREAIGRIGVGEPALTEFPAECRYCGYRKVGWCEGVRA